jgi:hypothetical protein
VSRLKDKNDRRSSVRFQLEREIRYKVGGKRGEESGVGQSINLSSSGVLFTTDRVLISGSRIELRADATLTDISESESDHYEMLLRSPSAILYCLQPL